MRLFILLLLCATGCELAASSADGGPAPAPSTDAGQSAAVSPDAGSSDAGAASPPDAGSPDGGDGTLAAKYPCDQGIASDPAVVWTENFEEGSIAAITARYNNVHNAAGMSLVSDVPAKSCGHASSKWIAGVNANATDLYKKLPAHDEWWVRWYVKYQPGVLWHHCGVWFGGYNPPLDYPYPRAGLKPAGNDLLSVSVEPIYGAGTPNVRYDTYDYWMQMHSWMATPMGSTAYYGNSTINELGFTEDDGQWTCIEVHVKLNTDLSASTGAALDVWKNDALVKHFDDQAPIGCWVADKFCPMGADGPQCTNYPDLCKQPYVPVDLQWRSDSALQLNYFWPQNYITSGPDGALQFDDMVVATQRIGCLR